MDKKLFREEQDSIGSLQVPISAYYGVQSLRGYLNFDITKQKMHPEIIKALAIVKKACAITNEQAKALDGKIANAIVSACDEIISGKFIEEFIVDAIQGGAGTSANMNANEVICNRAIEILGGQKGDYSIVHPNDHVNMSQSTNDVYPTAGKIACISLIKKLIVELEILEEELRVKAKKFNNVLKMGRTQLQDAVPMRLGQSFHAFSCAIKRDIKRIKKASQSLHYINMGGSAIGSAINVPPYYLDNIVPNISLITEDKYIQSEDLFDGTSNLDVYPEVSSALKCLAVNLSKMCNDLRLMSSGPKTGFGEINLPAKQNGSSIMPGKVNPVIPEVVSQIAFKVFGNDTTITCASEGGQLELNAFEPVIFYSLFESIECLTNGVKTLVDNCIVGITANKERCKDLLYSSVGMATVLCPYIGYKTSASLAKKSLKTGIPLKTLVLEEKLLDEKTLNKILSPMESTKPHHLPKIKEDN